MSDNILEIERLSVDLIKNSQQTPLLDQISFNIPGNKVTGIAGESGSGKTITALSVMRLCPPGIKINSGTINLINNSRKTDLISLPEKEIRSVRGKQISMIFQEPMTSLNPSLKCGFQVIEALKVHEKISSADAYKKLINLFNEVKLPDPEKICNSYPHQLSGGQRQRVMIAMSLIPEPLLLIADEPTTALDVTVQKKILELLKELMEHHKLSILFITHDLRLLREFAEYIVIMRNGKVIETGTSEKIFRAPVNSYTKGLIACQPPLQGKPERLITIRDIEEGKAIITDQQKTDTKINPDSHPILTINNLSVDFSSPEGVFSKRKKSFRAVKNINLEIYKGETIGLAGESGCGKTSLGKALLQLLTIKEGKIFFHGTDVTLLKGKALNNYRKKVQIIFQDPFSSLNPLQNTGDIITEPMKVHQEHLSRKEREDRCLFLLDKVGLPAESIKKYPHQFSGGQRQRIGIARCLAVDPELIILDEAVSALDVSVQAQILNLLNDLKKELNLTYLFISHELAVVKYMSDRILIMKEGEIIEMGKAMDIFSNPSAEYTKLLIGSIPGIH